MAGTTRSLTADSLQATGGTAIAIPSSGVFPVAIGGTNNGSLAVTAGGILYTDGSKINSIGAGTTNQVLTSNGSSAPTWGSVTVRYAQEVPSGTVNGATTAFTLANTPASTNSVLIILDGQIQRQTTDYTLSGSTVTFVTAPSTGQSIYAQYNY